MNRRFNRSLRANYSWLPRRLSGPILNLNTFGRCSLILAIMSDGQWVGMLKPNTVRASDFTKFLTLLCTLLELTGISIENDWVFTMDNASIHTCKVTTSIMNKFKLNIWYIPPYTPIFAPIELVFKYIKAKIKASWSQSQVNYSRKDGQKFIVEAMKFITPRTVIKTWVAVIGEWKQGILPYLLESELVA